MIRYSTIILFVMKSFMSYGQVVATFEVNLPVATNDLKVHVSVSRKGVTAFPAKSLSLVKMNGDQKTVVPFQVKPGVETMQYWITKSIDDEKKVIL